MPAAAGLIPITVSASFNNTCIMTQCRSSNPPEQLLNSEASVDRFAVRPSEAVAPDVTPTDFGCRYGTESKMTRSRSTSRSPPPRHEQEERGFISIVDGTPSLGGGVSTAVHSAPASRRGEKEFGLHGRSTACGAQVDDPDVQASPLLGAPQYSRAVASSDVTCQLSLCSASGIVVTLEENI
jgi:hypothetical protein